MALARMIRMAKWQPFRGERNSRDLYGPIWPRGLFCSGASPGLPLKEGGLSRKAEEEALIADLKTCEDKCASMVRSEVEHTKKCFDKMRDELRKPIGENVRRLKSEAAPPGVRSERELHKDLMAYIYECKRTEIDLGLVLTWAPVFTLYFAAYIA